MAPLEESPDAPEEQTVNTAVIELSQAELDRLRVVCWACGSLIQLPAESVPEGNVAADIRFTCGGCGVDNLPHSTSPAKPRGKATASLVKKWVGRFFLGAVPGVVVYVGTASFYLLYGSSICPPGGIVMLGHIVLAVVMEFQILWNYFATVWTLPSSPRKGVEFGTLRAAENDRLLDFTLCRRCDAPRPSGAHHCSTCARCIHDLDHHCVFVHNCIGYENRRSFVLFCGYAVIGCTYPLIMLWLALARDPSEFARIFYPTCMPINLQRTFHTFFRHRPYTLGGGFTHIPSSPLMPWQKPEIAESGFLPFRSEGDICEDYISIIVLVLLFVLSISVTLGVGSLFGHQMYLLAYGTTSLDMGNAQLLRHCATSFSGRCIVVIENIRAILGPPRSWLLPSRGPISPERGGRKPPAVLQFLEAVESPEASLGQREDEDCTKKEN